MLDPSFDPSVFYNDEKKPRRFDKRFAGVFLGLTLVTSISLYVFFLSAPSNFPQTGPLFIRSGWGLTQTSSYLKEQNAIRSELVFKGIVVLLGKANEITAGNYLFGEKENVWNVATSVVEGTSLHPLAKITIPEGMTTTEVSKLFTKEKYPSFDQKEFMKLAKGKEGYLFPDTYFFPSDITSEQVITLMSENFTDRVAEIKKESEKLGKKFSDIVIMASILEEEANDEKSMKIIAGILWKRIKIGLPLQVDASLKYITGRGSSHLTVTDLAVKSPYNTYTNTGLPPAPIANPGLVALKAALDPTPSTYLYFLTDNKGKMHYAPNFEDHIANKQKYLP